MMAKTAISRGQRDDHQDVDEEPAMRTGTNHDRGAHTTLLMSGRDAEVYDPDLPGRGLNCSGHGLYSGYSSRACGSPSPVALSVNLSSA